MKTTNEEPRSVVAEGSAQRAMELFLTHYSFVMRVAFRHAPVPDLIDDIIQETFHRFVHNAQRYDLQSDIRPLLKTIAKNIACDYWDQRQRERTKISQLILEHIRRYGLEQAASEVEPTSDFRREQPALERCLTQLTQRAQEVVNAY